jgi:predicted RNA-binding Zn-ribbon protein involved in translation (DUF1610 family)
LTNCQRSRAIYSIKIRKEKKMECPKCGAETIERRSYVGGHGDVLFEQCPGLACGWAEPMERLNTNLVQPLIRQRFEDEQGCQVWDVASMVALDNRWERAKEIVLSKNELSYAGEGVWLVKSQSRPGVGFQVSLWGGKGCTRACTCEDYGKRAPWGWCKHRLAAWISSQLTEAQVNNIRRSTANARS